MRRRKSSTYRRWTKAEDDLLRELYSDKPNAYLAEIFNRSKRSVQHRAFVLGIQKSPEFAKQQLEKGWFPKGHVPFNKGKKWIHFMSAEGMRNSAKTQFRGTPHNARPDGYEMLRAEHHGKRYWWIKPPGKTRMMPKHRWLWEQAHGEIPKGYNVQFKDGDTTNCVLENLYLITRDKQVRQNYDRLSAEGKAEMRRKIHERRNESIKRDKIRLKWGMEPKTKLVKRRPA